MSTDPYKMELVLEEDREDQVDEMCMVIEKYVVKVWTDWSKEGLIASFVDNVMNLENLLEQEILQHKFWFFVRNVFTLKLLTNFTVTEVIYLHIIGRHVNGHMF